MSEISVLFVCTGNICRSPTAEGVARKLLAEAGLGAQVMVDSAGLEGWHAGDPPDPRAIASAAERGYDLTPQRSRQFDPSDFERFALILGMDRNHVTDLRARAREATTAAWRPSRAAWAGGGDRLTSQTPRRLLGWSAVRTRHIGAALGDRAASDD